MTSPDGDHPAHPEGSFLQARCCASVMMDIFPLRGQQLHEQLGQNVMKLLRKIYFLRIHWSLNISLWLEQASNAPLMLFFLKRNQACVRKHVCVCVCVCMSILSSLFFFPLQRNPILFLFFFFFLNELLSSSPQPQYIYKMGRSKRILNTYFEIFHGKCHFLFTVSEIYLKTQSSFPPT